VIKIKPNVDIGGLRPEMVLACLILQPIFMRHGATLIITSGDDGEHGFGSLHFVGLALDFRSRDLDDEDRRDILVEGRAALGAQYDFIHEENPPHFHCEFQPKRQIG
jgi:hypothetical protein